ncbi:MAG: oligosaccharide flippase family protein [Deltaproteobacteria bacterium]|nr:oligosaccharide flippase family protein [Deltaproteobacteria bacterium]
MTADDRARDAGAEARGIGVNLLTLLAQASLPAFHVQLARLLGPGDYGLYSMANKLVDMASVLTLLGMDLVVTRQGSLAHANRDTPAAVRATGTALRVVLASGALVALGTALGAPYIAQVLHKPGLVTPLRTLVLVPIGYHAATMFLLATQARMVMKYDFWLRGLFQPLTLLALSTLALRAGAGLAGACAAVALGMTLTALLGAYFYGRELPLGPTLSRALRGPVDWALVRQGLPMVGLSLVWVLQGGLDVVFLGRFGPRQETDVGVYNACLVYVISLNQTRGAFYPIVSARLPALLAAGDRAATNAFVQRQQRWVAALATPLAVLFAGFGDGLLAVFGGGFTRGASALAVLAVGQLAGALAVPAYALLFGGNGRYSAYAGLLCVAVQLSVLGPLCQRYGPLGAALGASAGMVTAQVFQHWSAWRLHGVHGFSRALGKVFVSSGAGLLVGRALFQWLPLGLAPRFFLGVGAAAAVYLAALVALGLEAEERALLGSAWRRLKAAVATLRGKR